MEGDSKTVSESLIVTFTSLSVITCGMGFLGHLLVLLTFFVNRSTLLTPSNVPLLTMSLSDFLCALIAGPIITISSYKGEWPFSSSTCTTYGFCMTLFGLVNITHITFAIVERFTALEKTYVWTSVATVKNMVIISGCLVCYCLIFAIVPVLGWSSYTLEGLGISCSLRWHSRTAIDVSYHVILFVFCFFIPVIVYLFCYIRVTKAVRKLLERAKATWGNESIQVRASARADKKLTIMIGVMYGAFLFAWTPYAVVSFVSIIGYPELISPLAASVPSYLAKSSIVYNPFIYFFWYRRFRVGLRKCIPRALVIMFQRKRRVVTSVETENVENNYAVKSARIVSTVLKSSPLFILSIPEDNVNGDMTITGKNIMGVVATNSHTKE